MKKVVLAIRILRNSEEIRVFDNFDEIFGLYDYTEEVIVSETTMKKLSTADYFAVRYKNTIRAKKV